VSEELDRICQQEADERYDEVELYREAGADEVKCALALFRALGKDFNQYRAVKVDGPLNWTITKPRTPEALLAALETDEPPSPLEAAQPIIKRLNQWERFQTGRYGWSPPDGKRIEVRVGDLRQLRASLATPNNDLPTGKEARKMTEEQIKHMAEHFLGWRLPDTFNPDGGIKFDPIGNKGSPHEYRHVPVGTNLFSYTEAVEMVRHMVADLPTGNDGAKQ
jgi:hypothetical protein